MITEDCKHSPTPDEIDEESRQLRRLRVVVQLALQAIAAGGLSLEQAEEVVTSTRRLALEMFPGKEDAFNLLYRPKFQKLISTLYWLH
ncbi:MAG TPA: hypothetical protein VNF00_06815 [Candidatus Acidoferrales bacterium]|nr:hypothetical protein [Candidatus Acidoferrales bacterium]